MALFRNICVKLRVSLCDVLSYVSAQTLVLLDLAKNCSFLNWKPAVSTIAIMDGNELWFVNGDFSGSFTLLTC